MKSRYTIRAITYLLAFGALMASFYMLFSLPIQLIPNIKTATITVESYWPNSSSQEMADEVLFRISEKLTLLKGIQEITSFASPGYGYTELKFASQETANQARQEVNALLSGISDFPDGVKSPYISEGNEAESTGWVFFRGKRDLTSASEAYDYVEKHIVPKVRQINGIKNAYVLNRESLNKIITIQIDFDKMLAYGIELDSVLHRLRAYGPRALGETVVNEKRYSLRLQNDGTIRNLMALQFFGSGGLINMSDFAKVASVLPDKTSMAYYNGRDIVPIVFFIEDNADIYGVYQHLNSLEKEFNEGILINTDYELGNFLSPIEIIDQTRFQLIKSMIIGFVITVIFMLLFYKSKIHALNTIIFIPFTFFLILIVYSVLGIPLNIISVTGMAIATGVILDPAIIVNEHLLSKRKHKVNRGLILCIILAAATSVLVLLPFLISSKTESKVFTDLGMSFIIAIISSSLLPILLLPLIKKDTRHSLVHGSFAKKATEVAVFVKSYFMSRPLFGLISLPLIIVGVALLFPAIEYLPYLGNNTATVYLKFPQNVPPEEVESYYAKGVSKNLSSFKRNSALPSDNQVFLRTWTGGGYAIFRSAETDQVESYIDDLADTAKQDIRELRSKAIKTNILARYGGEKSVAVNLIGEDFKSLKPFVHYLQKKVSEKYPNLYLRVYPDIDSVYEIFNVSFHSYELDKRKVAESQVLDLLKGNCQGVFVDQFFVQQKHRNVYIRPQRCLSIDDILRAPVKSIDDRTYFIRDFLKVEKVSIPRNIMYKNGAKAFRLTLYLGANDSSSEVIDYLKETISEKSKTLDGSVSYELSEESKKVDLLLSNWAASYITILLINILLVTVICRSMIAGIIMVIGYIPAFFGAVLAINFVNLFLPVSVDIITCLGGVLMIGIVSNGYVILAYGFVENLKTHTSWTVERCMNESVKQRIRPILLTTISTIAALIPMVINFDETAILYRGLAVVLIGGIFFGSIFSLLFLPSVVAFIYKKTLNYAKTNYVFQLAGFGSFNRDIIS
ncbi:efflux RND transporter permease subunit [Exilibacterium tricleocarpae]|uniref:Efflux RND transporter permease subunit n=1 Tax=Exilibacterium tricleocarpae TaxID=2591008 RepID=A0A545SRY1_9GAMM|nr:efflux RND transporter permease subunit [Exilibacterium tricleocarpae]TQV67666.1 efflux RND transporter permease subunit [Exilibacterium tricleocarpae]